MVSRRPPPHSLGRKRFGAFTARVRQGGRRRKRLSTVGRQTLERVRLVNWSTTARKPARSIWSRPFCRRLTVTAVGEVNRSRRPLCAIAALCSGQTLSFVFGRKDYCGRRAKVWGEGGAATAAALVRSHFKDTIVGETRRDDAGGEKRSSEEENWHGTKERSDRPRTTNSLEPRHRAPTFPPVALTPLLTNVAVRNVSKPNDVTEQRRVGGARRRASRRRLHLPIAAVRGRGFDISNTDHVIPVRILDRVTFVCPQPMRHAAAEYEYSKLYAVSSWSYDNCELENDSDVKLVGVCQKPHQRSSISMVFRGFTPLPGGLEFLPGQSYYFITTSDGSLAGVDNRKGGLCLNKHMKIKFEVQPDERVATDSDEEATEEEAEVRGPPIEPAPRWPNAHVRHGHPHENAVADEQSTSLRPAVGQEEPSSEDASPTPVMYIIHTKSPDEDLYEPYHHRADQQGYQEDVRAEPDGARRTTGGGWWTIVIAGAMALAAARRNR
uniref:Ephrin RBD domain-containing protein n=1 Tax=Plectus sambesii TaxID=2011161 RepID=A0A914W4E2_9BILA